MQDGRYMRVFAIKDDSLGDKILAYLVYYEKARNFYIELPDDADPWETPLLLSSFAEKKQFSIDSYFSRLWVQQRIIPPERQNIGSILKENKLKEYDEFSLLLLSQGRCAQDDCYIEEIRKEEINDVLFERWKYKIEDVLALKDHFLLVFFRNNEVKIADMNKMIERYPSCKPYLNNEERFKRVEVQTDGYGICWSQTAAISDRELYENSYPIPLSLDDFSDFVRYRVVTTAEACQILNCSRQNIDDLVKRNKLHPVKTSARNKLFLRNEVIQRAKYEE